MKQSPHTRSTNPSLSIDRNRPNRNANTAFPSMRHPHTRARIRQSSTYATPSKALERLCTKSVSLRVTVWWWGFVSEALHCFQLVMAPIACPLHHCINLLTMYSPTHRQGQVIESWELCFLFFFFFFVINPCSHRKFWDPARCLHVKTRVPKGGAIICERPTPPTPFYICTNLHLCTFSAAKPQCCKASIVFF